MNADLLFVRKVGRRPNRTTLRSRWSFRSVLSVLISG